MTTTAAGNMSAFHGWVCNDPWYSEGLNCVGGWHIYSCGSYYPFICKIPYTGYKCMPPPRYGCLFVLAVSAPCTCCQHTLHACWHCACHILPSPAWQLC
jgi:hypothetical protein